MLKSIRIKNFKSFKDTILKLSPFTLIIGANASGKSNAIEAIQYIQWLLSSPFSFDDFIKIHDLRLQNIEKMKDLEFEISYIQKKQDINFIVNPSHKKTKEKDNHEIFIKFLSNCFILDTTPHLMRGYVNKNAKKLNKHGENLSAILYQLCKNKENKKIILDCIRCLPEQHITDIDFILTERDDTMLKLKEKFGKKEHTIDAGFLSDGTLRVLAIIAFILSSKEQSLLVIEEIDNGIHPSRLEEFLSKLKPILEKRKIQVIMTSHNPALLDAIPSNAIQDVVCCYRDTEEGYSQLVRLGDLYQYSELVAQGSLGKLVTNGIVDRFVHDKRKPEEIQKDALDWFAEFKKERGSFNV